MKSFVEEHVINGMDSPKIGSCQNFPGGTLQVTPPWDLDFCRLSE